MLAVTRELVAEIRKNGPTDPIEYYRRPVIGWLFRQRINLGLGLLSRRGYRKGLEIGYGAGAVQLALAPAVDELHGIDLDADPALVEPLLAARGHRSHLCRGNALELPYADAEFDLVVCFSVIEHLHEYQRALGEMARVLSPEGRLLLGMPSVNRIMELGFQLIGFKGIEDHHVTTPNDVRAAFARAGLEVIDERHFDLPLRRPLGLRAYHNWLLEKAMLPKTG